MEIVSHPEKCTGCMRCMLACSYTYTKKFSPSAARIKIKLPEYRIEFTNDCNNCGKCVEHCFYGALEVEK